MSCSGFWRCVAGWCFRVQSASESVGVLFCCDVGALFVYPVLCVMVASEGCLSFCDFCVADVACPRGVVCGLRV